jgi:hypothetical protein
VEGGPTDEGGAALDLFVEEDGVGGGLVVGREAGQHFEDEDAEGVPVYGFVIPALADDLRGSVSVESERIQKERHPYLRSEIIRRPA